MNEQIKELVQKAVERGLIAFSNPKERYGPTWRDVRRSRVQSAMRKIRAERRLNGLNTLTGKPLKKKRRSINGKRIDTDFLVTAFIQGVTWREAQSGFVDAALTEAKARQLLCEKRLGVETSY